MVHIYIDVEKPNSKIKPKREPSKIIFNAFISDCKKQLLKNKLVFVYHDYQLEELKLEFGDNLICKYNHENKYWTCSLKKE